MTYLEAAGVVLVLIAVWSIYKAEKTEGNSFNILDLIMESGKVSRTAAVFLGSWGAMTYVFVGLYATGKMTEGLFTAYGAVTIAPLIAKMFAPPPAPSTTTTESSTKVEVRAT